MFDDRQFSDEVTLEEALATIGPVHTKDDIIDEINIMIEFGQLTDRNGEYIYPEAAEYAADLQDMEDRYNGVGECESYDEYEELAANDNLPAPHPWWSMPTG